MLYALLHGLADVASPFNVFRYITFRTACSAVTAFVLVLALGPWMVAKLRRSQIKECIRGDGPPGHAVKKGTPTMGGLLIVAAVISATLLWVDLSNPLAQLSILGMAGFATLGLIDDYFKVIHSRRRGLSASSKMLGTLVLGAAIGTVLVTYGSHGLYDTYLAVPFFKEFALDLGLGYVPFTMLVLAATSHSVNFTDGLDGLAAGCVLIAGATYTAFAYLAGHAAIAQYLGIAHVEQAGEVTVFAGAIAGACLGFLWFNCHPADIFMGDVGSLSLGGSIGIIALLTKQELTLLIVGGVFTLEMLSVIIQVSSFKLRGKRVFRMAPLHHHFELKGWPESRVIVRFWIASIVFALLSLATLKLR